MQERLPSSPNNLIPLIWKQDQKKTVVNEKLSSEEASKVLITLNNEHIHDEKDLSAEQSALISDYMFKGTPKTSRFQKNLDSGNSTLSSHHYNPYLYTQHKTRPNAPFDPLQVKPEKIVNNSKIINEGTICGISYIVQEGSVPTIIVKGELSAFPNPYEIYRIMEPLGKKYGALKIDFSECDSTLFKSFNLNTEHFWFKPRKQHTKSFGIESNKKLKFHNDLYRYHKMKRAANEGMSLGKIPSIDKRTLDLYRLRSCVQLRGGFKAVCQKKLWAQIGRELGYSGRIMSSLSTSLRSAYLKVFLDYDIYKESEEREYNSNHEIPAYNSSGNAEIHINPLLKSKAFDGETAEDKKMNPERSSTDSNDSITKKRKLQDLKYYEFSGSSKEYFRLRDILQTKGFKTRFETLTEAKVGITIPNELTLPGYNYGLWNKSLEIYDTSIHEWKNSPIYNLRQYHEKAQRLREIVASKVMHDLNIACDSSAEITIGDFQKIYFYILQEDSYSLDIDTGIDLPTMVHETGFPIISKTNDSISDAENLWNLNSVNKTKYSMFEYLDLDYGSLSQNKVDIGMMLSTSGWSLEDGFLPLLDYSHMGSSKLWYIISPESRHAFEKLLQNISERSKEKPSQELDSNFKESEFYHSFTDTNLLKQVKTSRDRNNSHHLMKRIDETDTLQVLADDIQIPPDMLSEYNIRYFTVVQDPKTYIMKYPQTYSSCISSGFQISEKCLFAPKQWIPNVLESSGWLVNHNILPCILPFQLLVNIIENSTDEDTINQAKPILLPLIEKELYYRSLVPEKVVRVYDKFDPISDLDLSPTGASKIVISDDSDCLTLSIPQYLECESNFDENTIRLEMHLYYSDEQLRFLYSKMNSLTSTNNEKCHLQESYQLIANKVKLLREGKYSNSRIPLVELTAILSDRNFQNSPDYLLLKFYITGVQTVIKHCDEIIEKMNETCKDEIQCGIGFSISKPLVPEMEIEINDLVEIETELNQLAVSFEEMDVIFSVIERFKLFQHNAKCLQNSDNLELLKEIYQEGLSLGIKTKYLNMLANRIAQLLWLNVYNQVFLQKIKVEENQFQYYSLENMYCFLRLGVELFGDSRLEELQQVAVELNEARRIKLCMEQISNNKNHSISINDLEYFVGKMENIYVPISDDLKKALKQLLQTLSATKHTIGPMVSRLKVNEPYMTDFQEAVSQGNSKMFSLFDKFDGSSSDRRLTQSDALQEFETPIYTRYSKLCRAWQQDLNKTIPNAKHLLPNLLTKVAKCLDTVEDRFKDPSEERSVYCFCREADTGGVMVECEICREWYHTSCINNGDWVLPEDDTIVFCCQLCLHRGLSPPSSPEKYPHILPLDELQRLVIESARLQVIPDRLLLGQLFQLYKTCIEFADHVNCYLTSTQQNPAHSKFILRKLIGSHIEIPSLQQNLDQCSLASDQQSLQALLIKSKRIVSGFDTLT